jgi:hypothetical protein
MHNHRQLQARRPLIPNWLLRWLCQGFFNNSNSFCRAAWFTAVTKL